MSQTINAEDFMEDAQGRLVPKSMVTEIDKARGVVLSMDPEVEESIKSRIPLRIHSSVTAPDDPYAAVRYRGHWFYIDHADLTSKSTFNLLAQLFALQAGDREGTTPVLTIPVGG